MFTNECSVAISERPGFAWLLGRMENGDVLIGTKLDRLGHDAIDVRKTVEQLAASDIRMHCLALSGVDFISAAGKMTMQVILAVAEFEKDQLIERTHSGLARARAASKRFGQPPTLNQEQRQAALERLKAGASISAVAREFGTSRQTSMRLRGDAASPGLPE
ncbi:recombinase family protein [Enterobacter kobei]|uniref:recombinase family protein n=1 Tax=Enterobacter kobei TaxID=208224 RepID=UPI003EDA594F